MKITAVIAEYNPFHNGHLKQLRLAKRETEADILVVLMSGSFTQRGDLCVADRFTRANWAIQAGADAVLELPAVYTLSPAQGFAEGALKTLSMLGEYTLSFGTESDELQSLAMAAEFMRSETNDMSGLLKGYLGQGYSVAKSRTLALNGIRPDIANMLESPNNILAVEYIKASKLYGDRVKLHSVERKPDDGKKYLSSTKIRELLKSGSDIAPFVPQFVKIENCASVEKYGTISTYAMKAMTAKQLSTIYNVGEGLENRITQADFNDMRGFLELTSKRYTRSTIKRIAACATLGLDKSLAALAKASKPYCTLLAIKPSKKKILLPLLADSGGYFFFKHSDCEKDNPVRPLIDLDEKASRIQKICL
ncbi:MAG: nucleotidyltransferase family protein [Bacteroides sp.]|nr:nucleotidyltransferase family protein [Bacillota bacterium]MCM1393693.1 nucleotidyltransferase family protein [[Eubacterium] siraeum]MCM1456131.1 nucleotidyltransferase family protein [Bacteroides sp.]